MMYICQLDDDIVSNKSSVVVSTLCVVSIPSWGDVVSRVCSRLLSLSFVFTFLDYSAACCLLLCFLLGRREIVGDDELKNGEKKNDRMTGTV